MLTLTHEGLKDAVGATICSLSRGIDALRDEETRESPLRGVVAPPLAIWTRGEASEARQHNGQGKPRLSMKKMHEEEKDATEGLSGTFWSR